MNITRKCKRYYSLPTYFQREPTISLIDTKKKYVGSDFYECTEERVQLHSNWLKDRGLQELTGGNHFKWGYIGVARDKSDQVFIYLNIN